MSNAIAVVTYADVPGFPSGSAVSHIVATITDSKGVATTQTVAPGTATVEFDNVAPDAYSISVAGVDSSGAVLGSPITGTFTITAPATVTLSLPSAVSVSQA